MHVLIPSLLQLDSSHLLCFLHVTHVSARTKRQDLISINTYYSPGPELDASTDTIPHHL